MILKEEKRNLFEVDDKYYLAHCISKDCAMGAGIAVDFQKKFKLRNKLLQFIAKNNIKYPTCIQVDKVFNLITKAKYWHKPTYESLESAILIMKKLALNEDIKYIAMPKIASGLDGLTWSKVREIIQEVFKNTDIEILVCHL